jgi:hypothetical protein
MKPATISAMIQVLHWREILSSSPRTMPTKFGVAACSAALGPATGPVTVALVT